MICPDCGNYRHTGECDEWDKGRQAVPYYHAGKLTLMDYPARAVGQPRRGPSRDFLVTQAVLNAVPKVWPATYLLEGVAGTLIFMGFRRHREVGDQLLRAVLSEFRELAARYC